MPTHHEGERETLPEPPVSIHLTPLFGSAPDEHIRMLHSLYASQVAALVWTYSSEIERKGVVTGIALKKPTRSYNEENDAMVSEQERATFLEIMGMVKELLKQK